MSKSTRSEIAVRLVELLEESTIIQGSVTLMLVGAIIYLAATGQEIPDLLVNATMLVIGFWFGSKSDQRVSAIMKRSLNYQPVTPTARRLKDE